jgi:cytochrome c-type biogenesis protein CcmH
VTAEAVPRSRGGLRWAPWALLAVVVAVALAFGVQRHPGPQSLGQRVTAIAGQIRCPVCEGETAAESNTPESVAIRQEIRAELRTGEKPSAILAGLASAYGAGSLERPQTRGLDLLLWLLPVVATVLAAAALVAVFGYWRPRRGSGEALSTADRALVADALRHPGEP